MGKYILLAMLVATILLFGCLDQIGSPASDQQAPGSQQGSNAINATPHVSGNETVKNTSVAPPVTQPKAVLPIEKNLSQGQTIQVGNSSIMLGDVQSSPDGLDYALLAVSDGKGNRVDSLKIKKLDSAVILIEGKAYEIKCLDVYVGHTLSGIWAKIAVDNSDKKPADVGTVLFQGQTMAINGVSIRFAGFDNVPPFSAKLELIDKNGSVLATKLADEGQNAVFTANGKIYTIQIIQAARGAAMSELWIRITNASRVD